MVWQGPRIRRGAETGTQVMIPAMSTIFYFVFLACFWSCFSLCSLVFLPRAVLSPVSSSSSCYFSPCSSFSSCSLSDLLAPFVFCVISGFLLFCFLLSFFFVIIFWYSLFLLCSRTRYVGISLALRTLIRLRLFFEGFLCITVCEHRI